MKKPGQETAEVELHGKVLGIIDGEWFGCRGALPPWDGKVATRCWEEAIAHGAYR
jgi:hypothetical protein